MSSNGVAILRAGETVRQAVVLERIGRRPVLRFNFGENLDRGGDTPSWRQDGIPLPKVRENECEGFMGRLYDVRGGSALMTRPSRRIVFVVDYALDWRREIADAGRERSKPDWHVERDIGRSFIRH